MLRGLLDSSRELSQAMLPTTIIKPDLNGTDVMIMESNDQELPRIERPLDQLEAHSRKLFLKTVKQRDVNSETKAHFLLAGKGFDAEKVSQTLNAINVAQAFEPLQPLADTNVEGYLKNEQELLIVGAIEEARQRTLKDCEEHFERKLHNDWKNSKQIIFQSLGLAGADQLLPDASSSQSLAATYPAPSTPSFPGDFKSFSAFNETPNSSNQVLPVCLEYAQATARLNDSRLQNRSIQLTGLYGDASKKVSIEPITRSWELLTFLIGHGKERSFLEACAKSSQYNSLKSREFRTQLVKGGRAWLEAYFRKYLEDHIFRLLKAKAQSSSLYYFDKQAGDDDSKIRTKILKMDIVEKIQIWTRDVLMVHSPANSWEIVDGYPFWAIIFYLVRCGAKEDALKFAVVYEKYLSKTDRRFIEYFSAWCQSDQGLPKKLRSELVSEFNSKIRDGILRSGPPVNPMHRMMGPAPTDPYKYLLYRIIGRIGLEDTSVPPPVIKLLAGKIFGWEDDMWFQLHLVRESIGDLSSGVGGYTAFESAGGVEQYSLYEFYSRYVSQISPEQWTSNGQHPVRFFQILLLCGQFERAVQYLWKITPFHVDAFHFAVTLFYYGALRVADSTHGMELEIASSQLTDRSEDYPQGIELVSVNFTRLMAIYTKSVLHGTAHPFECLHYFLLLGLDSPNEASEYGKLCYDWIIDLVLDTGLIDDFFGSIQNNRRGGILESFLPLIGIHDWDECKRKLIRPAAQRAEKRAGKILRKSEFISFTAPSEQRTSHEARDMAIQPVSATESQENNAILLYNLAEDYDVVLDILSKRVSDTLGEHSLENVADCIVDKTPVSFEHSAEELTKIERLASSVLDFYGGQANILSKINPESRKTLAVLVSLLQFYRQVFSASVAFSSKARGQLEVDVRRSGVGFSMRFGNAVSDWSTGLTLINDIGLVPIVGNASRAASTDLDFAKLMTKADHLRREFSEAILLHLGDIFLGVEILLFIGYNESRLNNVVDMDFSRKSRELLSFVSSVGRWYKVAAGVRRRLVKMDEKMVHY